MTKQNSSDKKDRQPYTQNDIQEMIAQLGKKVVKSRNPHQLWIPLIALYNGMRQGEICQLFCDDIIEQDGIQCFRITVNQIRHQAVKNEQSRRVIPIHPTLIELGFIDYVDSCRARKFEHLWECGTDRKAAYYEKQDNYSHYFSKWYNNTFKKYFIKKDELEQKPFHSLRHTFINWFFQNIRSQDRDNQAVKSLVGHLETKELQLIEKYLQGITWDVYSKKLNTKAMLETLTLLDYQIDLTLLKLPYCWPRR